MHYMKTKAIFCLTNWIYVDGNDTFSLSALDSQNMVADLGCIIQCIN